jgi:hypothetical protein
MKLSLKDAYRNGNDETFHILVEDIGYSAPIEVVYHCDNKGFYSYYQLDRANGEVSQEIVKLILDKLISVRESMSKPEPEIDYPIITAP